MKLLAALKELGLVTESIVAQILSQPHTGFSVWIGEPVPPTDVEQRLFLSRYIDPLPGGAGKDLYQRKHC